MTEYLALFFDCPHLLEWGYWTVGGGRGGKMDYPKCISE